MALPNTETSSVTEGHGNALQTYQAEGAARIDLPSTDFIAEAAMTRQGANLILQTPDGETIVIEGYFNAEPAPVLHGPDGSVLTQTLVESFARAPLQFAAGATASDASPVGAVEEVKGNATVTRANGTIETITSGTPIYEGDIVQTDANGAVNIVFLDETSMAVSANARLAIDEYTFDPATESGTTNFSVLRGLFVFTSGLIGRDDPDDVKIETPVGSIGIRGTIIAGEINPGGESNISVLEGAIVIRNGAGDITLSEQFETVRISSFEQPMQNIGVISASDVGARFSGISDVNPSLFSVIGESAKEQTAPSPTQDTPKTEAAPQPSSPENEGAGQKPAPTLAPDVFSSGNDAPPALNPATSSGLPSSGTITGHPSGGLVDGTVPVPSAGNHPSFDASHPTSTASGNGLPSHAGTIETPVPPPSALSPDPAGTPPRGEETGGTPAGPGPGPGTALSLTFTPEAISDIAIAGHIVGKITPDPAFATYTFSNGTLTSDNDYFRLETVGGEIRIVLTSIGEANLGSTLDTVSLGDFEIKAIVAVDNSEVIQSFAVTVADAHAGRSIDLSGGPAVGIGIISDSNNNRAGYSISALGDANGDGFDDFIVTNGSHTGNLYKFYGSSTLYASTNIGAVATTTSIAGVSGNTSDAVVSGIGDFNGDGIVDYIVGLPNADSYLSSTGNAFIIDGSNPLMKVSFGSGLPVGAEAGYSVSGIGDFNNDGYADVLIGAPGTNKIYYMMGSGGAWPASIPPSLTDTGITGSQFGQTITALGDFNGDGYADFAVGGPNASGGNGYVKIYQGGKGIPAGDIIGQINGLSGDGFGTEVSSIGDFNGDGKTDLMVAGNNSISLVFGTDGGVTRNVTFSHASYTIIGGGGIGDFNGDGFDDFTLSLADSGGSKTYVVFGSNKPLDASLDLHFLKNPENALEINYSGATSADQLEISGIGDINGDGFADFAIGIPDANGAAGGDGGFAIVYGRNTGNITAGSTATADNQHLVGSTANDDLSDGGHYGTSLRGGAGYDLFNISNTNFLDIDGGSGIDKLVVSSDLNFTNVDFEKINRIEGMKFSSSDQTITLTLENIFNLLKTSDTGEFRIEKGSALSGLNLILTDGDGLDDYAGNNNNITDIANLLSKYSSGTIGKAVVPDTGGDYYRSFDIGGYKLLIDNSISVDAQ